MELMWAVLAAGVDLVHALLMAGWLGGLPLLFVHRWPSLTRAYGIYAVLFILVSQSSHWVLGECVLTTLARWCASSSSTPVSDEWFTVRLAQAVFHMTPSHRVVVWISEGLILVTAIGALSSHKLWNRAVSERRRPSLRQQRHPA